MNLPLPTNIIIKDKGKRAVAVRKLEEKGGYLVKLPKGGHTFVEYRNIVLPS